MAADESETDDPAPDDIPPERYEPTHTGASGSTVDVPVDGGEEGIVVRKNFVRVPVASAKFRLPWDNGIPVETRVVVQRDGDDVYCVRRED